MNISTNTIGGRQYVYVNGRVTPPIVLHSPAEENIAQNAHNLVWETYRAEWDAIVNSDNPNKEDGLAALRAKAKPEIAALVIAEITTYRNNSAGTEGCGLAQRVAQLEEELAELRAALDAAHGLAEEAHDLAEQALSAAEGQNDE